MSPAPPAAAPPALRRPARIDAVTLLTVYAALLLFIPSNRAIPGVGVAGTPAVLWGLGLCLWWVWHRLRGAGRVVDARRQLVRRLAAIFVGAVLISYIAAMTRAIPGVEIGPADNGLLRVASWIGVALVAADGIPSRERLIVLLRRIPVFAALVGLIGIAEFFLHRSLVSSISIPGLVASSDYTSLISRGDFVRSASTAEHPLEYAAMLAMAMPMALTLAMTDRPRLRPFFWVVSGVLAGALLVAGSRSAIVGLVVCVIPMIPALSARARAVLVAVAVVMAGVVYVAVPGLIGTLIGAFSSVGTDSSTVSRSASYGVFFQEFQLSPVVGRGFGTFLPMYRIFDNQYLGLLVEVGVLGTLAFLALILIPGAVALRRGLAERVSRLWRVMGSALAGALLAGAVIAALFDALSFPKAAGMLFFVAGIAGAYCGLPALRSQLGDSPLADPPLADPPLADPQLGDSAR